MSFFKNPSRIPKIITYNGLDEVSQRLLNGIKKSEPTGEQATCGFLCYSGLER